MARVTHDFKYNRITNPWHGARNFLSYSEDDSRRISDAVTGVCRAGPSVLVPVLADCGDYYVSVVRVNLMVNVVQMRVDFNFSGKYAVCERPLQIPDSMKLLFPHIRFESARISDAGFAALFWDVLRVESMVGCGSIMTKVPRHPIFLHDMFFYGGRNCFAAVRFDFDNIKECNDDGFRHFVSAVLLEAVVRPTVPFVQLIPFDDDAVEPRINRRQYVGVLRDPGSVDINVVHFDGAMKQRKVVFCEMIGHARMHVNALQPLPGFNVISRRLTDVDKDALMQIPVRAHWNRPANRIEPVASSLRMFANSVYHYDYNRAAVAAVADLVRLDAFASRSIQDGIASVCCSGGPSELLVPLQSELPPIGDIVPFYVINLDVRMVSTLYVELFNAGRTLVGYESIPDSDFRALLPHLLFTVWTDVTPEWRQSLILDALRSVWVRRTDLLIVVSQPRIVTAGVVFEYLTDPYDIKSLRPTAAERTERVIRAMCADVGIGSSLVPVPENGRNAFVAVVRGGADIQIGFISGLNDMHSVEPLRALGFAMPNLTFLPFVYGPAMPITPGITRALFEEPIFSYWHDVAEINPHSWGPRAAAFGLAMHSRAGADSPMRVLDAELIASVAMLCLQ